MYDGYLNFGGNEIGNNARTMGYARTAGCILAWYKGDVCDGIYDALGETFEYDYANIEQAPWYDSANDSASRRFFGVFLVDVEGVENSTRRVTLVEGVDDGGVLGPTRKAAKSVRVKAVLVGQGEDALGYGMAWLSAVLDPGACGQHGSGCGTSDLVFWGACPRGRAEGESDEDYALATDDLLRYLHDVGAVSGPLVTDEFESGEFHGFGVEFTFTAEKPWVYKVTKPIELPPSLPVVVQDIPFNLAPYPSAELAGDDIVVANNYAPNPSVETDATGWTSTGDGAVILNAQLAAGRTTELAAQGLASYRSVFTAAAASAAQGYFTVNHEVPLPHPVVAGEAYSVGIWTSRSTQAGAPVYGEHAASVLWRDAGNVTLRQDPLGVAPAGGGALAVKSIEPPVGATKALVRVAQYLTSWNAGTIVRLYADAVTVSVP